MEVDLQPIIWVGFMFIGIVIGKWKVFNQAHYAEMAVHKEELKQAKIKFMVEMEQSTGKANEELKQYLKSLSGKSYKSTKSAAITDDLWLLIPIFLLGGLAGITEALTTQEKETLEDLLAKCKVDLPKDKEGEDD